MSGPLRDYLAWHDAYDDPASELSARLRCVQREVGAALDRTAPRPVRLLSACSGDGRDVLDVLAARTDAQRVSGALVEYDDRIADRAAARIDAAGAGERLAVIRADAGASQTYVGLVPADLVLLSGIMGNISPEDIARLVGAAPQLCAPGATLIWTRGSMEPDLGPQIRAWFADAGFTELACHEQVEGSRMRVGVLRYDGPAVTLERGRRLFTFIR